MLGQLFVVRFLARATSRVLANRLLRFLERLLQALGSVRRRIRVAEVELELIRVFNVTLAATAKRTLQQLGHRQFEFLLLLLEFPVPFVQFFDRVSVGLDGVNVGVDGVGQFPHQRLARFQTGGNLDGIE